MKTFKDIRLEREAKELQELTKLKKYKDNPKDCPVCNTSDNFSYTTKSHPGHGDFTTESKIECSGCGLSVGGYSGYGYLTEIDELKTCERLNKVIKKIAYRL